MKKNLLLLFALFLSTGLFAQNIPFDQYGNVQLDDFENLNDDQIIVLTLKVDDSKASPGWGIGTIKPLNYDNDGASGAIVNYQIECKAVSPAGAINEYEFTVAEFKSFAKADGEYYVDKNEQSGVTINVYNGATRETLVAKDAPTPSGYFTISDFDTKTIGDTYPMRRWYDIDGTATVVENPAGSGHVVNIVTSNDNAVLQLSVTLPAGKTLGDYEAFLFDIYIPTNVDDENPNYKNMEIYVNDMNATKYKDSGYPKQANIATWTTKTYDFSAIALTGDDLAKSTFTIAFGMSTNKNGDYYINNVKLREKATGFQFGQMDARGIYSVKGGIQIEEAGAVSIYGISGQLILKTVVNDNQFIPLEKGFYIVKMDNNKAQKVLVK